MSISMKIIYWSLYVVLATSVPFFGQEKGAKRADVFSTIRCGTDVPKALIGQFMANERVALTEARHKDLGLKNLGGDEITEGLFSTSWLICGNEYMLISDKKNIVRDVLQVPQHSKDAPEFIGQCRVNNKQLPEEVIAILNNKAGAANLSAKFAWKIDPKTAKFVKIDVAGMQCPRSGIITADGGN
jgi:hypothetical protein